MGFLWQLNWAGHSSQGRAPPSDIHVAPGRSLAPSPFVLQLCQLTLFAAAFIHWIDSYLQMEKASVRTLRSQWHTF